MSEEDNENTPLQNTIEIIDEVKEKLNDNEYKNIMENLQLIHDKENRNQLYRLKLLYTEVKRDKYGIPTIYTNVIDREFSSKYLPNNFEEVMDENCMKNCDISYAGKLYFVCDNIYDEYYEKMKDNISSHFESDEEEENDKLLFYFRKYSIIVYCKIDF